MHGWGEADDRGWIGGFAAARRRAPGGADALSARGLQPAALRLLGAACCWSLAVWSLCSLCSLWFVSVAAAAAEQPQRTQRTQSRANRRATTGRPATAVRGGQRGLPWRRLL